MCHYQWRTGFLPPAVIFLLLVSKINGQLSGQLGPCPIPTNFPLGISLSLEPIKIYGHAFELPYAYVVTARNSNEVLTVTNWAIKEGYRVRAMGAHHSWSPLLFAKSQNHHSCTNTILIDTKKHFISMVVNPIDPNRPDLYSVTVGSGVTLERFLQFLESNGLGMFASPAVGPVTIGGLIATAGHGSGMPTLNDHKNPGHTYGTISNLVIELELVAWDNEKNAYVLKTVHRSHKDAKVFLTNLGRTFITRITLRVGKDQMLRSRNHFYIRASEVFSHPNAVTESSRALSKYANSYGRTLFLSVGSQPQSLAWILTWNQEPHKPLFSQRVTQAYNILLTKAIPTSMTPVVQGLLRMRSSLWKMVAPALYNLLAASVTASLRLDFWGPSKNHFLYVTANVPEFQANSFTVLTSQENLQLVVYILRSHFTEVAQSLNAETNGEFYMAGEFNIRITGVDDAKDVEIPGAESPSFSNASPMPEHPDYRLVVWCEISSFHDNKHMYIFLTKLQELYHRDIHNKVGILRVEWAKGWAHTINGGSWTNSTIIQHFSRTFSTSDKLEEWNWAVNTLNSYDPHKVFSNDFLDVLFSVQ